jgi:hypothetical protein
MFTWICPQCGREVPPAYNECPDCAVKTPGAAAPPPGQPGAVPPPPAPQYQQPVYQQPQYQPPQQYQQPPYPQAPQYPPAQYPPGQYPPQYQQPQYPPPPYPQQPYPQQPYSQQPQPQQPYQQQPPYPQQQPPQFAPAPPPYEPQYAPPPPPPPPPPAFEAPRAAPVDVLSEAPAEQRSAPLGSSLFGAPPAPPASASGGMPTWLLTILCTAGFAALVIGIYALVGSRHAATPSTSVESPAAKPGAAASPWQKFIEVSGVRFQEDPKHKGKIDVRFVLTNHSESSLDGIAGNVTIWAGTKKSDEDAQGSFAFTANVGPYESKEVTAPFNTKLKVYELPDWNVMNTDLQITNPAGAGSGGLP